MKKVFGKVSYILVIFLIILSNLSNVLAMDLNTKLEVIKESSDTKYLENDQGYISKTIVDSKSDKGEVTINLSLSNLPQNVTEEKEKYDSTEIFIIVSENIATDSEKLNTYISYIETLAKKVLEKNSNTKIGIIGMTGTISDGEVDENGNMVWGENDEGTVAGTADNAEIVVSPTENAEAIKNGLQNMNSNKKSYRANLQAAIGLANKSYSVNVNKLLISLYDGVPSIANGVCQQVTYGGLFSEYSTAEEAVIGKHKKISTKTKSEILSLKENNVEFILLRPEDTSYDQKWYSTETGELILEFDGSPYVKEIYGTLESPTYGKMYSLNNDNLEKIVTEYIYKDIIEEVRVDIKSVVINEYFSEDILENFDITFSNENADSTNLNNNGYIIWNVGDIEGNKTVNLQYTLKIKDMRNEELLDKIISITEKTEVTYINYLDLETRAELTDSPQIQLIEIKEEVKEEIKDTNLPKEDDSTIAPNGKLPNAGKAIFITILGTTLIIIMLYSLLRYMNYKDIKK